MFEMLAHEKNYWLGPDIPKGSHTIVQLLSGS